MLLLFGFIEFIGLLGFVELLSWINEKGPLAEMVRAILILEGANPETHEGAVTLLSLRFVKTRILPVDIVKKFKILLSRRTDVIIETIDQVRKRLISELET